MENDVSSFIGNCLHCLVSRTGEKIPRPLSLTLHGTKPNEVLHIDYLYMGNSGSQMFSYLLVIKDDFSSFVWLFPTSSATSDAAADALATWVSTFGCIDWVLSDQGVHFKNELLKTLSKFLKFSHHFTPAYSPQSNGTVERVCKEVLRACKALLLEFKMKPTEWPAVIEIVQSVLNHSPLERLGVRDRNDPKVYRSPLEVFTSHKPKQPLLQPLPFEKFITSTSLSEVRAKQLINIEKIQENLEQMHKEVLDKVEKTREKSRAIHNRKTNVRPYNFHEGDFVLVRTKKHRVHKLCFKWVGPKRINRVISNSVYEVQDLVKTTFEKVHHQRLILYRYDLDGKDVDPKIVKYAAHSEITSIQTIETIHDIKQSDGGFFVLIEWQGLPDTSEFTWEPLQQVFEDAPGIFEDFLHTSHHREFKKKAHNLLYK